MSNFDELMSNLEESRDKCHEILEKEVNPIASDTLIELKRIIDKKMSELKFIKFYYGV